MGGPRSPELLLPVSAHIPHPTRPTPHAPTPRPRERSRGHARLRLVAPPRCPFSLPLLVAALAHGVVRAQSVVVPTVPRFDAPLVFVPLTCARARACLLYRPVLHLPVVCCLWVLPCGGCVCLWRRCGWDGGACVEDPVPDDAFQSFPSGHASTSFACLGFAALYLLGKVRRERLLFYKMLLPLRFRP
jgi:membrane-associated phospholipid phosphatase